MSEDFVFQGKNGKITFVVDQMPGCCGIAVISHPTFLINTGKSRAYYEYADDYLEELIYEKKWGTKTHKLKIATKINEAKVKITNLYTEFNNFILNTTQDGTPNSKIYPFDLKRSKVLMTDYSEGNVYKFCTAMKWQKSEAFRNYKTNHSVYIFQLKRR